MCFLVSFEKYTNNTRQVKGHYDNQMLSNGTLSCHAQLNVAADELGAHAYDYDTTTNTMNMFFAAHISLLLDNSRVTSNVCTCALESIYSPY